MVKKIVIIGPESTGKSSLCKQLAGHYHTVWVEEYAREYLLKNGTDYTFDNLLDIAKGQVKREQLAVDSWQLANKSKIGNLKSAIFIDTGSLKENMTFTCFVMLTYPG
jgi:nicotinamide riboside kinase